MVFYFYIFTLSESRPCAVKHVNIQKRKVLYGSRRNNVVTRHKQTIEEGKHSYEKTKFCEAFKL
jgi:hypothetical protein